MVARAADLMGVEHIGIGSDLCQGQPGQRRRMDAQRALDPDPGLWRREREGTPGSRRSPSWFRDNRDFGQYRRRAAPRGF